MNCFIYSQNLGFRLFIPGNDNNIYRVQRFRHVRDQGAARGEWRALAKGRNAALP